MCKNDFISQKPYNESKLFNMGSDKYSSFNNISLKIFYSTQLLIDKRV